MLKKTSYQFIIFSSLITLISLGLVAYYATTYKILAPLAVIASAILGVTAAVVTIKSNTHTFMQTNSLTFQQSLQTDDNYKDAIKTVFKAINNRLEKPLSHYAKPYSELCKSDGKVKADILYALNTWERAGSAISHGIYDEHYLYQAHRTMVIEMGLFFRDFINEVQTSRNNPELYRHFTDLVLLWTIRRDEFGEQLTKERLTEVFSMLNQVKTGKRPKITKFKKLGKSLS